MSTGSPSTPSSCDSTGKQYGDIPSTSQNMGFASHGPCQQSPALAISVPSSQEATSPSETSVKNEYYYFSTLMANKASEEIELKKFDNMVDWYANYERTREEEIRRRIAEKAKLEQEQAEEAQKQQLQQQQLQQQQQQQAKSSSKSLKRKLSQESDDGVEPKKTYMNLDVKPVQKQKEDDNPLRKMEAMTNSSNFSGSAKITEMASPLPATTVTPDMKEERLNKLEKLDKLSIEVQRAREGEERAAETKSVVRKNSQLVQSPSSCMMAMHPPGQMHPAGPSSAGQYPMPYHPGMSPAYPMPTAGPMSAPPGGRAFPSPAIQQPPQYAPNMPMPNRMPMPGYFPFPPHFKPGMDPSKMQHPYGMHPYYPGGPNGPYPMHMMPPMPAPTGKGKNKQQQAQPQMPPPGGFAMHHHHMMYGGRPMPPEMMGMYPGGHPGMPMPNGPYPGYPGPCPGMPMYQPGMMPAGHPAMGMPQMPTPTQQPMPSPGLISPIHPMPTLQPNGQYPGSTMSQQQHPSPYGNQMQPSPCQQMVPVQSPTMMQQQQPWPPMYPLDMGAGAPSSCAENRK